MAHLKRNGLLFKFQYGFRRNRSTELAVTLLMQLARVAWQFWLGMLSNKGGRGQRNRQEIGAGAT